ncbi:MAG: hypothetical protein MJ187_01445 [Alphaproteobacteria bacterium]|nr:hypothetical protein [Alphaproteobacteria bacterium]
MAQKTAKKTTVKKTAEKKNATVKATVKKTNTKKTTANVAPEMVKECTCGGECAKSCACECCKNARRVIIKKLIITLIVFSLGFVAAKLTCCHCHKNNGFRGPRVEFIDGCLNRASVKCDHMREILPQIDLDNDGCITRKEWRMARPKMRGGNIVQETEHEDVIETVEE